MRSSLTRHHLPQRVAGSYSAERIATSRQLGISADQMDGMRAKEVGGRLEHRHVRAVAREPERGDGQLLPHAHRLPSRLPPPLTPPWLSPSIVPGMSLRVAALLSVV